MKRYIIRTFKEDGEAETWMNERGNDGYHFLSSTTCVDEENVYTTIIMERKS